MSYSEAMISCEEYIDKHIGEAIRASDVAAFCGYSLYHFCHVFRAFHGVPLGEYIREIRLLRAAEDIVSGKSVLDTALDYGYETHAGFTKAFTVRFGMSPSVYRKNHHKGVYKMKPEIKNLNAFRAIGYSIKPKDGDNTDILKNGAYWSGIDFKFMPSYPAGANDEGEVAAWIHPSDVSGELSYFFGYKTTDTIVPDGFISLDIPAAEYAIFTVQAAEMFDELVDNIRSTWQYIFKEWFDNSDYAFDEEKMCFEFYKGKVAQIFVPIKNK